MPARLTDRSSDYTYAKRKSRWPYVIAGALVALGIIITGSYLAFGKNRPTVPASANSNRTAQVPRVLDGVLVDPGQENLAPIAVIVENHSSVRPQSGLSQASVVYEALAEGGITRFLAVFAKTGDVTIGPVRSARPYFVDLAREYNGLFVHAGFSPQGKDEITQTKITDLDQFFYPTYFNRIAGKPEEHSLFTNLTQLTQASQDRHVGGAGHVTSWAFKDDTPAATPSAKPISIDFSTASYRVSFSYDVSTNRYLRSQGGTVQTDVDTTPIAPKNVAIMLTTSSLFDPLRRNITVTGTGKLLLFRDGQEITGTWRKTAADSRLQFLDSTGQQFQLNRGQTWVEVVDVPEKNVSY